MPGRLGILGTVPKVPRGPNNLSTLSAIPSQVEDYGNEVRQLYMEADSMSASGLDSDAAASQDGDILAIEYAAAKAPWRHASLEIQSSQPTMRQLLLDARNPDRVSKKEWFLPQGKLRDICTYDAVYAEVLPIVNDNARAQKSARYVCGSQMRPSNNDKSSARKIFAVFLFINSVQSILAAEEAGITDDDLPLLCNEWKTRLWSRHSTEDSFLDFFRDGDMRSEFYSKQWWVHVPFIAQDKRTGKALEYLLDPGTVMPWTYISEKLNSGGFGEVKQIEIHPDHHRLGEHESFALKTILPKLDEKVFRQETAANQGVRLGKHVVELLATFKAGDRHMLLFPWASGGSLADLCRVEPVTLIQSEGCDTATFIEWLATQCHGLVNGLRGIHGFLDELNPELKDQPFYGIHGDIKPENFLHFHEGPGRALGTLKVSDFGLLKFHRQGTRTWQDTEWASVASQTYRSPEHDIDHHISRKIDMWALGCVFSELLTWAMRGPAAIVAYRTSRLTELKLSGHAKKTNWVEDAFFVQHHGRSPLLRLANRFMAGDTVTVTPTPRLKKTVIKWIDGLVLAARCDKEELFIIDFLYFIRDRMLDPYRETRASCDEVFRFLTESLSKGKRNRAYWKYNGYKVD